MQEREDFNQLQMAILTRVCKQVLPPGTNIQKEAKEALQNATTIFINYLTATANDLQTTKKSINSQDVFRALELLELDASILGPVKEAVKIYQNQQKQKRTEYRKRKSESSHPQMDENMDGGAEDGMQDDDELMREEDAALDQIIDEDEENNLKRSASNAEPDFVKKLKE